MKRVVGLVLALVTLTASVFAQIEIAAFTSAKDIVLLGDAMIQAPALVLTPSEGKRAGAAWYRFPQEIANGFVACIRFQITEVGGHPDPSGAAGGDGIAFVIQASSDSAIGAPGFAIGYGGTQDAPELGIPRSIAVELDTWDDTKLPGFAGVESSQHIAVHSNGLNLNSADPAKTLFYATADIAAIDDGNVHSLFITYVPGRLAAYIDTCTAPSLVYSIDIASILALEPGERVWVGLTSGTQSAWERHSILSLCFAQLGCFPLPSCLAAIDTVTRDIHDTTTVTITLTDTTIIEHVRFDTTFVDRYITDTVTVDRDWYIPIRIENTVYGWLEIRTDTCTMAQDSVWRVPDSVCYAQGRDMLPLLDSLAIISVEPNPSDASVLVIYHLSDPEAFSLDLYSIVGELIVHIASGIATPGRRSARIETTSLATGVYQLVLRSGSRQLTARLIVIH